MKTKINMRLGLIATASVILFGCVKDRPITDLPDAERDRMTKAAFTGSQQDPSFWAYKVTVANTSANNGMTFTGFQSEMHLGYFEFTREKLRFINANIPNRDRKDRIVGPEILNEWEIKHSEKRLAEVDGYTTNREEENNYIGWESKNYFTVDWQKANITEAATFPWMFSPFDMFSCWKKASSELIPDSREVSADYIGFTVRVNYQRNQICAYIMGQSRPIVRKDPSFTVDYQYSFRKMDLNGNSDYATLKYGKAQALNSAISAELATSADRGETDQVGKAAAEIVKKAQVECVPGDVVPDHDPLGPGEGNPWVTGEEDPLKRKYGYFRSVRERRTCINTEINEFYVNRWNPNKKHDIYFAPGTPEYYKPVFYEVICLANRLFAKNGLNNYPVEGRSCRQLSDDPARPLATMTCTKGICFDLKENTGQKFGDLRYSFFKVIEELEDGPFGYGPSDSHPMTGEILASNTTIWTGLLKYYLKRFKYLADQEFDANGNKKFDSSLYREMMKTMQSHPSKWTSTSTRLDRNSKNRPVFDFLLTRFTFGYPGWNEFTSKTQEQNRGAVESGQMPKLDQSIFDFSDLDTALNQATTLSQKESSTGFMGQLGLGSAGKHADAIAQEMTRVRNMPQDFFWNEIAAFADERNHAVYPYSQVPLTAAAAVLEYQGVDVNEIERLILTNLVLHEFGHNLGLRHNFYGSIDSKNFRRDQSGKELSRTASVMDYLDMRDEVIGPAEYEKYDEAALVFAYSNGKKDLSRAEFNPNKKDTHYLFCTDEHTILGALCNRHDRGTTPSEIVANAIKTYDERYLITNYRFDRAYWNTTAYDRYIFSTMYNLKKPLVMWRTAFQPRYIQQELRYWNQDVSVGAQNELVKDIDTDIRRAIQMTIAFYDSVIQQKQSDRPWLTVYSPESGATERIGILPDKLFATYFLMGDAPLVYNPNAFLGKASYLTYLDLYGYRDMVEKILENNLTVRVDADPWFISFGKWLYANNATNFYNRDADYTMIEKAGLRCYTPQGLKAWIGIDPNSFKPKGREARERLDTTVIALEDIVDQGVSEGVKDNYYRATNEHLGITEIDGNFYVASNVRNKYSFTMIDNMYRRTLNAGDPVGVDKDDVLETYLIYRKTKMGSDEINCYGPELIPQEQVKPVQAPQPPAQVGQRRAVIAD